MTHDRRARSWILVVVYLGLAALWLGFAGRVVPAWLADAYHGRGIVVLNRVLARTSRRPLDHYLNLWRELAGAVLLGLAAHATVLAVAIRHQASPRLRFWLEVHAALFLAVTILVGPRQDYPAYLEIWDVIRRGGDPWWVAPSRGYPLNAYGPLFILLTPLAGWNPLAPKILFATVYLLAVVILAVRIGDEPGLRGWPWWAAVIVLVNPFFWVEVGWYGHFDILVAVACLGAVALRERRWDRGSGVVLGLGVLLKYLPVVLGPFLAVEGRRLRPRFVAAALGVTVGGMALALAIWGEAVTRPLRFNATRPSQLLSIFRFLRGADSPLRLLTDHPNVDALALPILLCAAGLVWLACWFWRIDITTAVAAGLLVTLVCYKVGFAQYQTVLVLYLPYWWSRHPEVVRSDVRLLAALGGYLGWIVGLDVLDLAVGGTVGGNPRWAWVEDVAGLPTFVLGSWLLVELIRVGRPPGQRTLTTSRV